MFVLPVDVQVFIDGCLWICMDMACYFFVCLFIVSVLLTAIHLGRTPGSVCVCVYVCVCVCVCVAREEKEKCLSK